MTLQIRSLPFVHVLLDGFATSKMLAEVTAAWPGDDWPGWVRYDPAYEGKRASDLTTPLPIPCSRLLAQVAAHPIGEWLGMPEAVPDLTLHGAGLHEMHAGDSLGLHLDADGHPHLGLRRAWSAVLYVHECWSPGAGGELHLCDADGETQARIDPVPGRLVAFDCRDGWHAVARLHALASPRRALTIFGYLPEPASGKRPRAWFRDAGELRDKKRG